MSSRPLQIAAFYNRRRARRAVHVTPYMSAPFIMQRQSQVGDTQRTETCSHIHARATINVCIIGLCDVVDMKSLISFMRIKTPLVTVARRGGVRCTVQGVTVPLHFSLSENYLLVEKNVCIRRKEIFSHFRKRGWTIAQQTDKAASQYLSAF